MTDSGDESGFASIRKASSLTEVWNVFDPTLVIDPTQGFYIPRTDPKLQKLTFDLKRSPHDLKIFLCGHRGSGKTTELNRLRNDLEIKDKYFTIFLTAQDFGAEVVHLTHDALLVEIGSELVTKGSRMGMPDALADKFNEWGREVVTFSEAGLNARVEVFGAV